MSTTPTQIEAVLQGVRRLYESMERFDLSAAEAIGVDRSSLRALNALEKGPVSPSQLAARLGLTAGAVTALLDRLEAAGHVSRLSAQDDRRRRDAQLTRAARVSASRQFEALGRNIANALATMKSGELQVLELGLQKLGESFDYSDGRSAPRRKRSVSLASKVKKLKR
jgi:DNA-binding MarR family transcriptional regulator